MPDRFRVVDAEKLAVVRRWRDDQGVWERTGRGPDGTKFPPSWPLSLNETYGLIHSLAGLSNEVADDLNTRQIVTDETARDRYAEQARQRAFSVPRMEARPCG